MFRFFALMLAASLLFVAVPSADAGELEPHFAQQLKQAAPDDMIRGLLHMTDQVDLQSLRRSLLFPVRLPAAQRHEKIVKALMDLSETTQADLLKELREDDRVAWVNSFWIANAMGLEAKPAVFVELAARSDVAVVFGDDPAPLIEPVASSPSTTNGFLGVEPGIQGTRAPELWNMGIKGQGVIVCNIDTGVDGTHPALKDRWRGLDLGVLPAHAFFDPVTSLIFPKDFNGHGTHTMGTICGNEGTNQVGMAPEAKWIAAATIDRVSIDQTKIDAYKSFEWCADPDGNPNTFTDVPAVASNSWGLSPFFHGVPAGWDYFNLVIDACEAAGCTVVFAAGNEGYYGSESIRVPADRIASPVNVLSVGSLLSDQQTRSSSSSMGPSGIDHQTIKPEVMAQGDNVRSCKNGGGYMNLSGTSMACPHVAGAIALLRCAYPDATPDEIKSALYYTAKDLGPAGEDNQYGNGIIDCVAAYHFLGQALAGDTKEFSIAGGNHVAMLFLNAGVDYGNRQYVMFGSVTGNTPGLTLPGGLVLPINWDIFTTLTLSFTNSPVFNNFSGVLDAEGRAVAILDIDRPPSSVYIGTILSFAYCAWPPPGWDFVSNNWDIEITP